MEAIEDVITNAYVETERIFIEKKKIETFEERTNSYLDKILELTEDFNKLNTLYESVNFEMERTISSSSDTTYLTRLIKLSKPLIESSIKLYSSVRKSKYYPGMKSTIKKYHDETDNFRELITDMKLKIKLISGNHFTEILRRAS